MESAGIKFNDLRGTGVSLRSQRMKLPANVGQKKTKALEQTLNEFKVGKRKSKSEKTARNLIDLPCRPLDRMHFYQFIKSKLNVF